MTTPKKTPPPNPMTEALNPKPTATPTFKKGDRVRYVVPTIHADGKTHDVLYGTVVEVDVDPPAGRPAFKRLRVKWDDEMLDAQGNPKTHWDPDVDTPMPEHLKPAE